MNREELETITNNNLEIQELNKYIKKIQEAYKQLEKENLELKKKYENAVADYEYEKYKNQRAIEYIETHKRKDEFLELNEWGTRELLDTLKETNERE